MLWLLRTVKTPDSHGDNLINLSIFQLTQLKERNDENRFNMFSITRHLRKTMFPIMVDDKNLCC